MTNNTVINETNVKDVIRAFENVLEYLQKHSDDYTKRVIEEAQDYLDKQYANRIKDDNINDIHTRYEKIDNGYKLIAEGKDVIYEEFGTGDRGEQKPHPEKSKYDLDDYNSGLYIRSVSNIKSEKTLKKLEENGIESGHYWTYKKDGEGDVIYTQGVPAGKEMWNTRNYVIKKIIPKIQKEMGLELREKFENTIKK